MAELGSTTSYFVGRERLSAVQVATALIAFLLIAGAFLSTLNASPLIEPDEPRYAEIAREMVVRSDWLTPTLNYVKYFEKPPLTYWLIATNLVLLGQHDWAVRLWSALFGLLGVVCTAYLAWRMFGFWVGVLAGGVLASTPLYFGLSQVATPDMPLTALCTISLVCAWRMGADDSSHLCALRLCFWVALALAVLAKGPVALVLVWGPVIAYALVAREFSLGRKLLWLPGVCAFLLLALPWFLIMTWRHPEFANFFFLEQHVVRYVRPWEHREPPWFYVPVLLLGTLPWWLVAVLPWRKAHAQVGTEEHPRRQAYVYLLCWFGVVVAFFSLSGSKLGTYVAPALPPLAVLFADRISRNVTALAAPIDRLLATAGIVLGFGLLAAARLAPIVSLHHRAERLPLALLAGAGVLLGGGVLLSLIGRWRKRPQWVSLVGLVAFLLAVEVAAFANRSVAEHYTPLARAIRQHWQPGDRIVLYRHYTQGIPYYTGQRVVVARSWGELDFGRRHGDHADYFWAEDKRLIEEWAKGTRMFLVINKSDFHTLSPSLAGPRRELARWGKKLLVVNF